MSAYPALTIGIGSSITPESGVQDDIDDSGGMHSRVFHTAQYYAFTLVHPGLTKAQYTSLLATYTAGKRAIYTLLYPLSSPASSCSVQFTAPPEIVENHGNGRFDVRTRLRGTMS